MVKRSIASCLILSSLGMMAQSKQTAIDSTKLIRLDEVNVISTRVGNLTPVAHTNVSKEQIAELNTGKDLPYLLSLTPSVTTTSDAGNGMGYTTLRVRGVDPSRINITANGIQMNDAESAQVYWVNIPDFASSAENVQIQRGAGTSTNGAGAFGATVNIQTMKLGVTPSFGYDMSAGSYGTHKETFRFSSGLLNGHWAVQGRLSNVATDGYIDRASVRLGSYFLQAAYFGPTTVVKFITFNGTEKTYMAWNYTSKAEQSRYGRRYNSCGMYYDAQGKMKYYDDQYDNYHQQHYQLHWNQWLGKNWTMNVALHYTHDNYYYDQMKMGKKLYEYLLTDDLDMRADMVQRKDGIKDFYGMVASANYDNRHGLTANIGGAVNHFDASHLGHVMWVGVPFYKDAPNISPTLSALEPNHQYYDNDSRKTDANIYAKVNWEFVKGLSAYVDLQYRHVNYRMDGSASDWDDNGQIIYDLNRNFDFFNPKAGLNYDINRHHRVYASYAIAHREPTRDHFQEQWGKPVHAERLNDLEVGYQFRHRRFSAGVNLYWMDYKNQFVLTGELNDVGEAVTVQGSAHRDHEEHRKELSHGHRDGSSLDANRLVPLGRKCHAEQESRQGYDYYPR